MAVAHDIDKATKAASLSATSFATRNAPYLNYLVGLSCNFQSLYAITGALERNAALIDDISTTEQCKTWTQTAFLKIMDVSHNNSIRTTFTLGLDALSMIDGRLREESCLERLVQCLTARDDTCHTRVVLLETSSKGLATWPDAQWAAAEMLLAHVLGEVLQINPYEVAQICQFRHLEDASESLGHSMYMRPSSDPRIALLGDHNHTGRGCLVHWLPDASRIRIVIMRACDDWPSSTLARADGGSLGPHPTMPMPCSPPARRSLARICRSGIKGLAAMETSLRNALATAHAPWPDRHCSATLRASLQVDYGTFADDYVYLQEKWLLKQKLREDPETAIRLSQKLKKLLTAMAGSQDQAAVVCRELRFGRDKRLNLLLDQLAHLRRSVERTLLEVEDHAEIAIKLRSLEMNETAIKENKAAIALTVLAYFFIPLNLASSIFGMNIQEINGTGSEIWVFILSAVIAITISLFGLFLWRVSTHRQKYTERLRVAQAYAHTGKSAIGKVLWLPYDAWQARKDSKLEEILKNQARGQWQSA